MSSELAAGKTLELLDTLKGTVQDFAARSDKLNEDYHARAARERLRCQAAVQEQARQLAAAIAEAEAGFQAEKAGAEAKFEQRKSRIGRAYQSSKELALKQIEDRTGGRKYELQKRMLQAERDRDTGLSATTHAFEEFRSNLAAEQQTLGQLEGAVQRSFQGYKAMLAGFFAAYEKTDGAFAKDENQLLTELRELLARSAEDLKRFRHSLVLRCFRYWPVWVVLAPVPIVLVPVLQHLGHTGFTYPMAGGMAAAMALGVLVRFFAKRRAEPLASSLSRSLALARRMHDACLEKSETHRQQELQRIKDEYLTTAQTADQALKQANAEAGESRVACRMSADDRTVHVNSRHEKLHGVRIAQLQGAYGSVTQHLKRTGEVRIQALRAASDAQLKQLTDEHDASWRALETEWAAKTGPVYQSLDSARTLARKLFPPWTGPGPGRLGGRPRPSVMRRSSPNSRWIWTSSARPCPRTSGWRCPARPSSRCRSASSIPSRARSSSRPATPGTTRPSAR